MTKEKQSYYEEILIKLLTASNADEVDAIVNSEPFFQDVKWVPIGGPSNEMNVGRIEGQMKKAENALVEKITNSIDAILIKKCREANIEPTDTANAPKSLDAAIDQFLGGEEGFKAMRKSHSDIIITAEGKSDYPTMTVIDRGEGQEPNDLPNTILGLSNRLKVDIPFVYGKYHQGGSAALRFSGGNKPISCYQLVLSRRAKSLAPKNDSWGFSLVRKRFVGDMYSYIYCVSDEDEIFTVPGDFINPFIEQLDLDFPDGTLIKIFDYQLTKTTNIAYGKGALAEEINKKLLQPAIPIHLRELRAQYAEGKTTKSTQYTIGGLLRLISDKRDIVKEEFTIPADLGPLGKRDIRFLILQHVSDNPDVATYMERKEKIFYVDNGLCLNTQLLGFLSNTCQLPDLAKYIICVIDISDVSPQQTNIAHSAREEFAETADYRNVKERLKLVMQDRKFIDLQREYKNKQIASTEHLDKEADKLLESALREDRDLIQGLEIGDDLDLPADDGKYPDIDDQEYVGAYMPEDFELIGSSEREIVKNGFVVLSFRTGAVDDFLDRQNDCGICEPPNSKLFSSIRRMPRNGIVSFRVHPKDTANIGDEEELTFRLDVPSSNFGKAVAVKLKIVEKEEYIGQQYPTFLIPQKRAFKIPVGQNRKLNLRTDVANDFFESKRGILEFNSPDLELKKFSLKDGLIKIDVECLAEESGTKEDIVIKINCDNGIQLNVDLPLEVVEDEDAMKFNRPGMEPVGTPEEWVARGWNEDGSDIGEVVVDTDGITVYYNSDSQVLKKIKNHIRADDFSSAEKMYMTQCYLHALYLYLEFKHKKESEEGEDYIQLTRLGMRAFGKSLVRLITSRFRS